MVTGTLHSSKPVRPLLAPQSMLIAPLEYNSIDYPCSRPGDKCIQKRMHFCNYNVAITKITLILYPRILQFLKFYM